MPVLILRSSEGTRQSRILSKDQPLAIGRHASNDIQVDEDGVATLHCRISWGGKGFQIASANSTGVVVNNQLTFRTELADGDLIKVGSLELSYRDIDAGNIDDIALEQSDPDLGPFLRPPSTKTPAGGVKAAEPVAEKDAALTGEIIQETIPPPLPKKKKKKSSKQVADSLDLLLSEMAPNQDEQEAAPLPRHNSGKQEAFFSMKPVRPGERDVTRSPVVLMLGAGILALILVSLTLLFLVKRESAQQAFDLALGEFKQNRFSVSIERFNEFLQTFPKHDLAKSATAYSNLAKAEQVLAGTAPDWKQALALLEQYVRSIRDLSNFAEMQVLARDTAFRIALSSSEAAGAQKKREFIESSTEAARMLEMNSPSDQRPTEKLKQIADAQAKAERIIRRFDFINESLGKITGSLERRESLPALKEYQQLIDDYPDSAAEPDVSAKFQEILTVDQSLVKTSDTEIAPVAGEEPTQFSEVVLNKATKARADLADSGVNVFALIGSACYAVDSGTGATRWKTTVGANLPFAPIPVTSNVLCILIFDTRHQQLVLLQQRDGKAVWKVPVGHRILGTPVIHEGRILFLAEPSQLMQVELASGQCTKVVEFPQPVVGAPVLIESDNQIVVAGERQFTYLLDVRSLECRSVIHTGQREQAIQSPLIRLGHFVLYPEIDQSDSTLLAVWDFSKGKPSKPLETARVPGHVRDQAVLRGKQLFVPSTGERVTSFLVADQPGSPVLTRTAGYQVPNGGNSPCFLRPGPEEELWMGSSLVQRLELSVDSIVPTGGQLALGSTTQPLQIVDQDLVAVGHPKGIRSFVVIGADRRQLSGRWQLLFGGHATQILAASNEKANVSILTDGGDFYEVRPDLFKTDSNQEIHPIASLPDRPEGYGEITAVSLPKKGVFVTAGLPEPHWWLLNAAGQLSVDGKLPEVPQCSPIAFEDGVILPFNGKLVYLDPSNPKRRIENFIMASGNGPPDRWIGLQSKDSSHFIAATRSGRLSQFQLQSEPTPHIFELSHVDRQQSGDFVPSLSGENVFTSTGNLLECWDSSSWERLWNAELKGTVSGRPRMIGDLVVVEIDAKRIQAYRQTDGSLAWESEIDSPLAGDLIVWKDRILIPLTSGTVISLPIEGNADAPQRWNCGRNLSGSVLVLDDHLILSSDDGSWIRVDSLPGGTR